MLNVIQRVDVLSNFS